MNHRDNAPAASFKDAEDALARIPLERDLSLAEIHACGGPLAFLLSRLSEQVDHLARGIDARQRVSVEQYEREKLDSAREELGELSGLLTQSVSRAQAVHAATTRLTGGPTRFQD